MPHAALWVVQQLQCHILDACNLMFQCRTRLCGWCNQHLHGFLLHQLAGFNAARGFVGGATTFFAGIKARDLVSMPHAALWVVQLQIIDVWFKIA